MSQRTVLFCAVVTAMAVATVGCHHGKTEHLPPPKMLMEPGPGVGGPGPGVMLNSMPMPPMMGVSQVAFLSPVEMQIAWDATGGGRFDSEPRKAPARQDFMQGAIYRLQLSNIPGRPQVELYPTIEIAPATPRTEAYLAHSYIPIQFTDADLDQVLSGNFVTKVIYLPDDEYQEMAQAGIEELVSTRLDPGVDPIVEADRRGSILAIVRIGNKNIDHAMMGDDGARLQRAGIRPAGYYGDGEDENCAPGEDGGPQGMHGGSMPMAYGMPGMGMMPPNMSGVTTPQYGMPITGTPIGLPGPPHIPLGVPAGLQQHKIVNHTSVNMPRPNKHMRIDVQQRPGYSYPKPVRHIHIEERAEGGGRGSFLQPAWDKIRTTCGY